MSISLHLNNIRLIMPADRFDGLIHYVVGFSIDEASGKAKATREKADALQKHVSDFKLFSKVDSVNVFPVALRYIVSLAVGKVKKPDVLILRVYFPLLLSMVARLLGITVVGEVHTRGLDSARRFRKSNPIKYAALVYSSYTEILASKLWDGLIFNHPDLEDYWVKSYSPKCPTTSVYNGSSPSNYYIQEQSSARERLGIDSTQKVLLFLGSVSPWHGVEYITKAAPYPEGVKMYIVGGRGNHHDRLEILYKNESSLVFVGKVTNAEAREYINAADVCLLPVKDSRVSPGSPLKLYDYLMCGRTVLVQEGVKGYSDQVEQADAGFVIDFRDADKIQSFVKTYVLTNRLGSRDKIRQYAVSNYSWDARMQQWLQFIHRIA